MTDLTSSECILRAMTAAEIAETTLEPRLRRSFEDLSSDWLSRAAEMDEAAQGEGV